MTSWWSYCILSYSIRLYYIVLCCLTVLCCIISYTRAYHLAKKAKSVFTEWIIHLNAPLQLCYSNSVFCACVCMHMHLPTTVCGFFVFDGSIQDIRACHRPRRKRWESSVFKGQESHVKLPMFTPATKWTALDTNCLPMRRRPTFTLFIYFLSHSSPSLCFPAQSLHNINKWAHELVVCYVCDLRL